MKTKNICGIALASVIGVVGCASKPPAELRDARAEYQRAARTPGANLAQTEVYEAKKALDRAEVRFEEEGDEQATRDVAYVAKAKALAARASASALASEERARHARAQLAEMQIAAEERRQSEMQTNLQETQEQLDMSQRRLDVSKQTIESERQARMAADKRAKEALSKLAGMKAEEQERGLVLTMSGTLLFETGKAELRPHAQDKLAEVAKVLKDDGRHVRIIGHTDSTGSDETNRELSRQRAEAVKQYLSIRGVPDDRMTAEGVGSTQPIASNDAASGRATNRRVEIVLEGSAQGSPQGDAQQTPKP